MAPENAGTLKLLRTRLARPQDPIPQLPPNIPVFNLDEKVFHKNVRVGEERWSRRLIRHDH